MTESVIASIGSDTAVTRERHRRCDPNDQPDASSIAPRIRATRRLLVQEGDIAADYLERLLDIVDYDGDIDLDVENDRAIVAIVGTGLQSLVGPRGETLDALQELTRLAVAQKTGVRSRLMLDVSGHRQARRSELTALADRHRRAGARVRRAGPARRR